MAVLHQKGLSVLPAELAMVYGGYSSSLLTILSQPQWTTPASQGWREG